MSAPDLWDAPVAAGPLAATVRVPGSKSLTARWLLLAALAEAPTRLLGALDSRDTRLMREALTALGARFATVTGGVLSVDPIPPATGEPAPEVEIDCGLAGTVMRFVPLLAALRHGDVRFTGDSGALSRPMGPVIRALREQGVAVTEHGEEGRLPITVHGTGRLAGGRVEVDASASSQFVSNVLLVGSRGDEDLELVHVGESLPSLPHIDMTIAALGAAGVRAEAATDVLGRPAWEVARGPIRFADHAIEPDLSNAGPFLAAALVAGGAVTVPDWPDRTTQPGDAYRELLARMGGTVSLSRGALTVRGTGRLRGMDADMSAVGELVPTIAALAALAVSPSRLRGVGHLRGHETDRLAALAAELSKLGAATQELDDGLAISPGPLSGTVLESYADHRMATAGAIVGLRVPGVQVVDIATTRKTLPDFPGMWERMLAGTAA